MGYPCHIQLAGSYAFAIRFLRIVYMLILPPMESPQLVPRYLIHS